MERQQLDSPQYHVLYRNQRTGKLRMEAIFRKASDARLYMRGYRALKKHELVTLEVMCEDDPDKVHLLYSICHRSMDVVIVGDTPTVMPEEVAAVYESGDEQDS